jgi:hypothetical protein
VEHEGKQFIVVAKVQHFLGEAPEEDQRKGRGKKN